MCFHKQVDHDDDQLYHSFNVSHAVVKISGLAQFWFWRDLSKEVTRVSKCFPFDILIDTLTSDTIYQSNLKYRFSIYIAFQYAALLTTCSIFLQISCHWPFYSYHSRWVKCQLVNPCHTLEIDQYHAHWCPDRGMEIEITNCAYILWIVFI